MVFNLGKRTLAGKATLLGTLRPLTLFGSGVPAALTFCESLADADDAALMRLGICQHREYFFFLFAIFVVILFSHSDLEGHYIKIYEKNTLLDLLMLRSDDMFRNHYRMRPFEW